MSRKSKQERIDSFVSVHGDKYDYSLVPDDITWCSKIPVICREHGLFEPTVNNHSRGSGCPACAGIKKLTREERIAQARSKHADKYDYSHWPNQVNASTRVEIGCPDHGYFKTTIASHVNHGSGCPVCAGNANRTWENFVRKAAQVHENKYRYKYQSSVKNTSDVTICCPVHGDFTQNVSNHLSGKGCSSCATTGFRKSIPGHLYLLKSNDGKYAKVGISNKLHQRLSQLRVSTPFDWSEVRTLHDPSGGVIHALEKIFHHHFESAGLSGFSGATEWLLYDEEIEKWFEIMGA